MLIKRKHGWEVPEEEVRPPQDGPWRPADRPRVEQGFWLVRRAGPSACDAQNPRSPGSLAIGAAERARQTDFNLGLRRFRLRVYDYMACGLALSGTVAHLTAHSQFHIAIVETALLTPFVWPLLVAPLGLVMLLSVSVEEMSFLAAEATFWAYAALTGFSLGCIMMVYTGVSIAPVFLVVGATFAAMSLYGHATRTDLSKSGAFLVMGLAGVALSGVASLYLALTAAQSALSIMGVILFAVVTAWEAQHEAQHIEGIYDIDGGKHVKKAVVGALALYLDVTILPLVLQARPGAADR
jgi:FtsH-binding integral membrane protein